MHRLPQLFIQYPQWLRSTNLNGGYCHEWQVLAIPIGPLVMHWKVVHMMVENYMLCGQCMVLQDHILFLGFCWWHVHGRGSDGKLGHARGFPILENPFKWQVCLPADAYIVTWQTRALSIRLLNVHHMMHNSDVESVFKTARCEMKRPQSAL